MHTQSRSAQFLLWLELWKLQVLNGWLFVHWHFKPLVLEWELAAEFVLVAVSQFEPLSRHVVFQNTIVDCLPWLLGTEL